MADTNLTFAKIVANPTVYSWSQVYSAGKLFAVISLETQEDLEEKDYLNVLGKEILDTLEQEFFTLESKDLESIKEAVLTTSQKIPQDINCSFVIGSIINNILYVYVLGNGRVSLKRGEKLGSLLEVRDQKPDSLKTASGFLQDNDIVILQTKQFSDIISVGTLSEFTDNLPPSEIAENLAPLVHEKEEAGAASIIINYKTPPEEERLNAVEPQMEKEEDEKTEESPFYTPKLNRNVNIFAKITSLFPSLPLNLRKLNLNHPRKVILTIVVIILVVFAGSVFFAVNKQKNEKTQAAFQSIYPEALKKYDEGQSLMGLNQNLARDSFNEAKQILEGGKDKLPKNSKEEKEVLTLLEKINNALESSSGITSTKEKQVDIAASRLLLAETKNTGVYFSEDDKNIYGLTSSEVFSLDKDGTNKKTIIKNDNSWQDAVSVFPYIGNVYVLDKKQNQILKFVATSDGYSKADYFPESVTPDFSKAVSMAIDSSIYVLSSDGNVAKFTKGNSNNFSLSGLDKPLSNPSRIFTNADTDNIYILDNGNSRIVVFDKNGVYKNQYQSAVIKNAKGFDVKESNKVIYILSGGKEYQIDLK